MNFFQAQQQARTNTRRLVILFVLAVLTLIVCTNLLVMGSLGYLSGGSTLSMQQMMQHFNWDTFWKVSAVVVSVVVLANVYKLLELRRGGAAVADMMGAALVPPATTDPARKRLLNIVEEMAIASGTPVPPVYVMENEQAINAFAAGYHLNDAVVAVSQGALDKLSRAQMQGVVAHEFSHILNGDMRLNIRLISVLHGILVLGIIGHYLMRMSGGRSSNSRSNSGGGGVAILGLGLMLVGFAGSFFGNLIKAGVSRKREFLADASAVQFTRDPEGIGGALKRIGADSVGSELDNPRAEEISHAFFGEATSSFFSSWMATHPPLEDRIQRILPHWDGRYDTGPAPAGPAQDEAEKPAQPRSMAEAVVTAATVARAIDHIGETTPGHLQRAQQLLGSVPRSVLDAAREPHGARAVFYTLVLDRDAQERARQLEFLQDNADGGVYEEVCRLLADGEEIPPRQRLVVVDLALSCLHQLSAEQYRRFRGNLDALIEMDQRIELFEWVIQKIVMHSLDPVFGEAASANERFVPLRERKKALQVVLSCVLQANDRVINGEEVFSQAMQIAGLRGARLMQKSELDLNTLDQALDRLAQVGPLKKPQILKACAHCILSDGRVGAHEIELFRAIAIVLDCPAPPLVAPAESGGEQ